jgi:hypothetical protein
MEILKINTGVYNLLLIEVPSNLVISADLDRKNNIYTITEERGRNEEKVYDVDYTTYLDDNSREVRELGLWSLLQEKNFRSLLLAPIGGINNVKLYFTKTFDALLANAGWSEEKENTLILRI